MNILKITQMIDIYRIYIDMKDKIQLGEFEIPKNYFTYKEDVKREMCDNILDKLYLYLDKELHPKVDRLVFLRDILVSSLESNEEMEYYEVAAVINDCIKLLDEDRN